MNVTSVIIVDTNIILRIILNDNPKMADDALNFISGNDILIKNEVFAEVAYVLFKLYAIEKSEIVKEISKLLKVANIRTESDEIVLLALETFRDSNLDFVDCLLYAYNQVWGYQVFTFDKKLRGMLD